METFFTLSSYQYPSPPLPDTFPACPLHLSDIPAQTLPVTAQLQGGGPGEARGALAPFLILRCAFPGRIPSRDRPLSQLLAQPPGFYFMNCLFKEDLLGHPERTRGEGERELSPAAPE